MTDLPDEELASAYLDGEATPEERARVESDPELTELVDRMRGARDQLVDEPIDYPPASVTDETIRNAVQASTVVDLRAERARRRLQIASVAAAVIVVIGVLGALVSLAGSSSDNKASTAAGLGPTTTALNATAAEGAAGALAADSAAGFLGTFADRGQLIGAIQAAASRDQQEQGAPAVAAQPDSASARSFSGTGSRCAVSLPPDTVEEVVVASAILDGREVQIDAYRTADGSLWIIVTNVEGCGELFTQSQ